MNLLSQFQHQYIRALLCVCVSLPIVAQASDDPLLFEEAVVSSEPESHRNVIRSRSVIVTDTLLTGSNLLSRSADVAETGIAADSEPNTSTALPAAKSLQLNLFDNLVVKANLNNAYENHSGSRTWIGKIESGTAEGVAVFVIREGEIHGVIEIPGKGKFSIRPGAYNAHIIEEIDGSSILTGESDVILPKSSDTLFKLLTNNINNKSSAESDSIIGEADVAISNDDGSIIDVYVGYDRDSVPSATAESLAELFIAYTNHAYENSGITQRVWLVGDVDGFDDVSSSVGSALLDAQGGDIPGLHAKRDEHHADLVMLFTYSPSSGSCHGFGFAQETDDLSFQSQAFSAMEGCTSGNNVFAHELGHNMGGRHDWYMEDGIAPTTYAHGYVDTANSFRTIMSYGDRCSALGGSCNRIPHFSNPLVTSNGNTTGIAGGTSTSCSENDPSPSIECDADNSRNFNEKAAITSQFRDSQVIWTGTAGANWNNASNWSTNRGAPGSTTVTNQVPRSYDNVYIPAGLSNYPTITGNAKARELTIASGASLNMTGGTLTVAWAWEDTGGFNATAGTVKLTGPIGITLTSSSSFHNLEIGSGSDTAQVTLDSNLDVNGDFSINNGAVFKSGNHQVNLAGNFNSNLSGFNKGTSQVTFDGVSQLVSKSTTSSLLNEGFDRATGQELIRSAHLPLDWSEEDFNGGDLGNGGMAISTANYPDTWLLSKAVSLAPGTDYTLRFDYNRYLSKGTIQSISVHYGTTQSSGSMTHSLGSDLTNDDVTEAFQTQQISFTVPTAGTYYLGFNVKSTDAYTRLDNITLDGSSSLQFHDLTLASSTKTTFLKAVEVSNDLQIDSGATADFGSNLITVEGTVINNGEITQSKTVVAGSNTVFAAIKNKAGTSDKYSGIEINPTTNLGNTTVSVKGNQLCTLASGFVLRCYHIEPTTSGVATIKFYHRSDELNGNTSPTIKTLSGTIWSPIPDTAIRGGSGDTSWASGSGLTASGTFGLDDVIDGVDTTPAAFSFTHVTDVATESTQTSNTITVSDINAAAPISITGGRYRINGGAFTDTASTVDNGDEVTVQHIASASENTAVSTELTIGGVKGTFTSTTVGEDDTTPAAFSFVHVTDVATGSTQTSNTITVSDINAAAPISITGGSYRINGGAFTDTAGTVNNGDEVTVQHTASASANTVVSTELTIGGVNGTFTSTTASESESGDDIYVSGSRLSSGTVLAGESVTAYTTQAYTGTKRRSQLQPSPYVGYYLSQDDELDSTDVLLAQDSSSIGSDDLSDSESASVQIPASTPGGTYHILFVADYKASYSEGNEENNIEAVQFNVPSSVSDDLYVSGSRLSLGTVLAGESMTAYTTQAYTGTKRRSQLQPSPYVGYYLSQDDQLDSTDVLLAQDSSSIGSDDLSDSESASVQIPASTPGGTYHILFVADYKASYSEGNEENNIEAVQFNVPSSVSDDLYVSGSRLSSDEVLAGRSITAYTTQAYTGTKQRYQLQPYPYVGYYLSQDNQLDDTDELLAQDVSSIGSDDLSDSESASLRIPSSTSGGTYHILFVADYKNSYSEDDESNNLQFIEITVQ